MRYTLAVAPLRGEVLLFPHYGENEYLTAVAIAREASRTASWTEVREEGKVCVRYRNGHPERGQPAQAWTNDRLSHQRHDVYPARTGWDDQWP